MSRRRNRIHQRRARTHAELEQHAAQRNGTAESWGQRPEDWRLTWSDVTPEVKP